MELTFHKSEHSSDFRASVALLRSPHGTDRFLLEGLRPENEILQVQLAEMANQCKFNWTPLQARGSVQETKTRIEFGTCCNFRQNL